MPLASLLLSSLPFSSLLHRPNFASSLHSSAPIISITNPNFSSPPLSLPFSTRSRDRIISFCSQMLDAVDEPADGEKSLSQGVPFFHSGDEILRSKSLDRDSYNCGDWFDRLDFHYESYNWGVGLPPEEKNERKLPLIKPRLANPAFKPGRDHILAALQNFIDLLKIRYSSPLSV